MGLTDTAIRGAKGREQAYKLSDGGGLYLLVSPTGSRYWRLDYRFNDKRQTIALGVYPDVSLAEARNRRATTRELLARGINPMAQRKLDKLTAKVSAETTFRVIADEWAAKRKREGKAEATLEKERWMLADLSYPLIGERPIGEISALELLSVLRKVEETGRHETANRMRGLYGRIFRYAIATGRAERDPAADLKGALTTPVVQHRAALFSPDQVGALVRAIEGYEGKQTTLAALRLAILVFVRPGELRCAEWAEIDLDAGLWRIPAEKMKMRAQHIVPLARQAVAILRQLHRVTGSGRYVFPSLRTRQRPMSECTMNAALRRLGYSKEEVTPHGFRRTASTLLNERGFNRDWIERQLAHRDSDEVRATYNAAEYLAERRGMMQAWADLLDQLANQGRRTDEVAA
jgi:integrase